MSETAEALELVLGVESTIERLMNEHRERREHWYFHDFVPWEEGRSFVDEPWDPSQATLRPEVQTALVLNLLTEDNLPYYYALFQPFFPHDAALTRWSRLWTAEEGQHAVAMRSYLLATRSCDPKLLEDDRMAVMETGWFGHFSTIVDVFCYTSAQELATRVSHRNAGVKADDEVAHTLMSKIARDENHHFIFYRGVTTELLAQHPDLVLGSLNRVLQDFQMPGTGIPGFQRRALKMARLGIYNLRIHAESIVDPLLRHWKIDEITGLSPRASKRKRNSWRSSLTCLSELSNLSGARTARRVPRFRPARFDSTLGACSYWLRDGRGFGLRRDRSTTERVILPKRGYSIVRQLSAPYDVSDVPLSASSVVCWD